MITYKTHIGKEFYYVDVNEYSSEYLKPQKYLLVDLINENGSEKAIFYDYFNHNIKTIYTRIVRPDDIDSVPSRWPGYQLYTSLDRCEKMINFYKEKRNRKELLDQIVKHETIYISTDQINDFDSIADKFDTKNVKYEYLDNDSRKRIDQILKYLTNKKNEKKIFLFKPKAKDYFYEGVNGKEVDSIQLTFDLTYRDSYLKDGEVVKLEKPKAKIKVYFILPTSSAHSRIRLSKFSDFFQIKKLVYENIEVKF